MKLIFAPDSFKGSLSASALTEILRESAVKVFGNAQCVCVPVADGGEGTVDALVGALGGEYRRALVTGPLGDGTEAVYGILPSGTAVIELAQASGLPLVKGREDVLCATSRGTGELLLRALADGAKRVLLGLGGSAVNDGGLGFLRALGARLTDDGGKDAPEGGRGLEHVRRIDLSGLSPLLLDADIQVICDVDNPLLGPNGATWVYGPQKGGDQSTLSRLEAGMERYAAVLEKACGRPLAEASGAGAAGGMGAALRALGAKLRRGVDAVLDAVDFDGMLGGADLVITGEGRMDGQSLLYGKAPSGVRQRCLARGVPVVALVGAMEPDALGFCGEKASVMTTISAVMPLEKALADASSLARSAAERMFRMIKIGMDIGHM